MSSNKLGGSFLYLLILICLLYLLKNGYKVPVFPFSALDFILQLVRLTLQSPSSIAVNKIKNPVAHCWSAPQQDKQHLKKRFCCVCRKRLDDAVVVCCDICDYFVHLNCKDFAVSDCKECATYSPHRDLNSTVNYHHWREGESHDQAEVTNSKIVLATPSG
jgi:hypothetical protein